MRLFSRNKYENRNGKTRYPLTYSKDGSSRERDIRQEFFNHQPVTRHKSLTEFTGEKKTLPLNIQKIVLFSTSELKYLKNVSNNSRIQVEAIWFSSSFVFNKGGYNYTTYFSSICCDRVFLKYNGEILDFAIDVLDKLKRYSMLPCIYCFIDEVSEISLEKMLLQLQKIELRTKFQLLLNKSYDVSNLDTYYIVLKMLLKHINQSKVTQFSIYNKDLELPLVELDQQALTFNFEFNNRKNIRFSSSLLRKFEKIDVSSSLVNLRSNQEKYKLPTRIFALSSKFFLYSSSVFKFKWSLRLKYGYSKETEVFTERLLLFLFLNYPQKQGNLKMDRDIYLYAETEPWVILKQLWVCQQLRTTNEQLLNVRMFSEMGASPKCSWDDLLSNYVFYSNFTKLAILSGQRPLFTGIGYTLHSMKFQQLPTNVPGSTFTRDEELNKMYGLRHQLSKATS